MILPFQFFWHRNLFNFCPRVFCHFISNSFKRYGVASANIKDARIIMMEHPIMNLTNIFHMHEVSTSSSSKYFDLTIFLDLFNEFSYWTSLVSFMFLMWAIHIKITKSLMGMMLIQEPVVKHIFAVSIRI